MENKKKKVYDAPQLTVVSFKTERGFALSGEILQNQFLLWDSEEEIHMEPYSYREGWANENGEGFWL